MKIPVVLSEDVPPGVVLVVAPTTVIYCPNGCPSGTSVTQCAATGRSPVICACSRCGYIWEVTR